MEVGMGGSAKAKYRMELGGGAQFWGHLCPQTETPKFVKTWEVTIKQKDGSWSGIINSDDPEKILQTPNLSGTFEVTVTASGENFKEKVLSPVTGCSSEIGCRPNCAAMVGIAAAEGGDDANFWTSWDAVCQGKRQR